MQIAPPKKKLSLLRLSFFTLGLILILYLFQLFGPNPRIKVASDTTYVTDLVDQNGFPNYLQHVIELAQDGVTPENNAAVLIAQAMWPPSDLESELYQAYCDSMGLKATPASQESLVEVTGTEVSEAIESWLVDQYILDHLEESEEIERLKSKAGETWPEEYFDDPSSAVYHLSDEGSFGPWTSDQIPPLAVWVKRNEAPLDLIVEASTRSHYLSMPSEYLKDESTDVTEVTFGLHDGRMLRGLARALMTRAMWHAGEGRRMTAWRDLSAIHRISRMAAQHGFLIDQLVTNAVDGMACTATQSLLLMDELKESEAEAILSDLEDLQDLPLLHSTVGTYERCLYLDLVAQIPTGEFDARALFEKDAEIVLAPMLATRVDWNHVLRNVNQWSDRMAAVAQQKDYAARKNALLAIGEEVSQLGVENNRALLVGSLFSSRARSQAIADAIAQFDLPMIKTSIQARERSNVTFDLTRITARLALYRARHGSYPESLESLTPDIVEEVPIDVYSGKPPIYERRPDGFLLYSVYENGFDDGGTSIGGSIVQGEWNVEENREFDFDSEETDLVVLAPLPAFKAVDLKKSEIDDAFPWDNLETN